MGESRLVPAPSSGAVSSVRIRRNRYRVDDGRRRICRLEGVRVNLIIRPLPSCRIRIGTTNNAGTNEHAKYDCSTSSQVPLQKLACDLNPFKRREWTVVPV